MFNIVGITNQIRKEETWHLAYANRVIDNRLKRAINWYRNNYYYVAGQHILYRILHHLDIGENIPDEYVEQYVYNTAFVKANALGFTSYRNVGKLHYGNFYGPNTTEVITIVENNWDWDYVKREWQELSPVIVLRHDQTHISYNLMTIKNYVDKPGFAIIQIDINLLVMQYLAWRIHHRRIKVVNPEHKIPNIGYFLGMVVLPNMLPSHLNQVIINKNCMLTDDSISPTIDYVGTSFYVNTSSQELDADIKDIFSRARNGNYNIAKICQNIHGIGDVRAITFMDNPPILLNRQNKWVYVLAMSRFLKHCLNTPAQPYMYVNRGYINRFKYELLSLKGGKVFDDYRIADLKPLFEKEVEWLFNL